MPTSIPEQIPLIVQTVNKLQPKTVLDIGCGNGKYGFLIKEYFPEIKVDAIEVFEQYIKAAHRENYGSITIGNVLEMDVKPYDLYLIIDVLEHWPKEEAMILLRKLIKHGDILISTPRSVAPQGAEFGNVWETHVSQWLESDWDEFTREGIYNDFAFIQLLKKQ